MSEYNHLLPNQTFPPEAGASLAEAPELIKVSARSRSTAVAGAIAGVMREHGTADVQAIGAGAVNQAVKALAIARGYLERDDIALIATPYFTEVDIDGKERTAVRFRVEPRPLG
ncbi:MAG: stage V sporulation protein S [Chloroflexi bacterium]|nr:stage V sporulation protein S [Chloroflexota bacterium]MCY4247835.1 stage V sporulation protein S [Chloroflexota bacterium]